MMSMLAIDTSTSVLSIAVSSGDKLLGEYTTNVKLNHSTRLMPAINQLLGEVGVEPSDLSGIAVAKGPGSYTGVRIGVTTAKVLSWTLGIPLVGISSLAILAANLSMNKGLICPIFDARRGQVYTGLYRIDEEGMPVSVIANRIVMLDKWLEQHYDSRDEITFVGSDLSIHSANIQEKWGNVNWPLSSSMHVPRAGNLASLGAELLKKGIKDDIHTFSPDYLQMTEAEYNWNQQQQAKK